MPAETAAASDKLARVRNERPLDASLRGYLETNADIVTRITKPVRIDDIGALSAQSALPIVFENIVEKPGFRLCDMFVRNRLAQARALGVTQETYLKTLAFRLRQPPRGLKNVRTGPVKEIVRVGSDVDWTMLPIPRHKDKDAAPYVTAMNIIRDPETGFYNSCHAGTYAVGPRRGLISFITPHSHIIMNKYRAMGKDRMPIAFVFGIPPAYEIMGNFSGLHMDMWGENGNGRHHHGPGRRDGPVRNLRSHRAGARRDRRRGLCPPWIEVPGWRGDVAFNVSPAALRAGARGRDHRDDDARRPADLSQSSERFSLERSK